MKKSSLILGTLMGLVISVTTVSAAMATKPFTDVPTDHWAYQAVEAGRLTGLWEGYADGTFGRDKSITRAEVAVAMYRNNQMMMDKMSVMQKAMDDKLAAMEKRVAEMEKEIKDGDMGGDMTMGEGDAYYAGLSGAQEVPAVNTSATGMADFWMKDGKLMYKITVKDLSGAVTAAHIHAGEAGKEGDPVHPITFNGNTAEGSWALSEAEMDKLMDGMFYVNVHTAANTEGEIRGQILPQMYMANFKGSNVVPAVNTTATGTGKVWIEDGMLKYEFNVKDLSGDVTSAHIYMGEKGKEGTSVHDVTFNGTKATGSWTLTEENWMDLADNMLYVEVNTAANPEGEIRAQIESDFGM